MGRETTPPLYYSLESLAGPPVLDLYGTSKTHFCFGRPPDPLGALAAIVVLKALTGSNGHISLVQALILLNDHSIGIYSLSRCRWTPHLLHSNKYSLSYAPPKIRNSRASLPRMCCPLPQHSQCWALPLGNAPLKSS